MVETKNRNIVTAVLNIFIVYSSLFFNIWDYSVFRPYTFKYYSKEMSTIALLDEGMYNSEALIFFLAVSFVALLVCSIFNFQNKKSSLANKIQIVASIVIVIMFALVHTGVFEFIADFGSCDLTEKGFVIISMCIINVVISTNFLIKNKKSKGD